MKRLVVALAAGALMTPGFAADTHAPHWDYKAAGKWGELSNEFASCKIGKEQSPIDISTRGVEKANLPAIKLAYKEAAGEIVNNGHTIQVNLTDAGSATVPSGDYGLLQFHFHTPSEEKVDGKAYPLVAHLVHRNAAGNLAVIAVLFKSGKENAALKEIFSSMPSKEGKAALKSKVNVAAMMPAAMGYYAFKGSLTTPPCSEGVAWQVLKTPVEVSNAQLRMFSSIFKMNARPVQPLNGRKVQEAS